MTKLNEELITKFAEEIADGMPVLYTCDLLEVHHTTYFKWMQQGEADAQEGLETIHSKLRAAIKKAYALFLQDAKATIRSGRNGWQGTAWWLERTNKDFMPKQQIQADDEGKVTVVIGGKPKDTKPTGKPSQKA